MLYDVNFKDGRKERISVNDFVPRQRMDLQLELFLPSHLCDQLPGAVTIAVSSELPSPAPSQVVNCP